MRKRIFPAVLAAVLVLLSACGAEPQERVMPQAPDPVEVQTLDPEPQQTVERTVPTDPTPEPVTEPDTETVEPTVQPVTEPQMVSEPTDPNDPIVWKAKSGKVYHSNPTCSGMVNPVELHLSEAVEKGLKPCQNCYGAQP